MYQMLLVDKKGENRLTIGRIMWRTLVSVQDQFLWVVDKNPEWNGPREKVS